MTPTSTALDSLASNRMGELAPGQRSKILFSLWRRGLLSTVFLFIGCGFFALIIAGILSDKQDSDAMVSVVFIGLLLIAMLIGGLWQAGAVVLRLLDISAGRIEQGEGRLTWRKSSYVPETQDRRLKLMDGLSLTPGAYRFYYLPRSGLVINVEALGTTASAYAGASGQTEDELTRALAEANRLQVDAYPNFRLGQMDEADKQRRLGRAARGMAITVIVALAVGAFFGLLVLQDAEEAEAWLALLFIGGFDVLLASVILWSIWRTITDLREGKVLMREGPIQRVVHRGNKSVSYYYKLGDLSFSVSAAGYNALVAERSYRVYYLPRSKTLLGIEPLGV